MKIIYYRQGGWKKSAFPGGDANISGTALTIDLSMLNTSQLKINIIELHIKKVWKVKWVILVGN